MLYDVNAGITCWFINVCDKHIYLFVCAFVTVNLLIGRFEMSVYYFFTLGIKDHEGFGKKLEENCRSDHSGQSSNTKESCSSTPYYYYY